MPINRRKHQSLPGGFFHLEEEKTRARVTGYGHGDHIKLQDEFGNVWQGAAEHVSDHSVRYRFRDSKGHTLSGVSNNKAMTLRDENGKTWKGFVD